MILNIYLFNLYYNTKIIDIILSVLDIIKKAEINGIYLYLMCFW